MTPWWVTLILSVGTLIIGIVIRGIWERFRWWPFTPISLREYSYHTIINPNNTQKVSFNSNGRKSLHLEKIIPAPGYVPNTLHIKCFQNNKTLFNAPLVLGMSDRGILNDSKLLISIGKPLKVEINNISNLNQEIRLSLLYSGGGELSITEA